MDNYYPIEIRIASKNGWFTPDESRAYYGRYSRDGVAIHWWGDGTGASNHDNIVNYELAQASAGNKSCNYVVSDNKITMVVNPDNVAWCTFAANAYSISLEIQPTLTTEGYKKVGWLIWQLRGRYNKQLWINGHKQLVGNTDCPGTLDMGRMEAEATKWANGGYGAPAPTPPPPPATANLEWIPLGAGEPTTYVCNKNPTNLWNFNQTTWGGFGAPVKQFNIGSDVTIYARVINHTLNAHYLVTKYSYDRKVTNGFNEADLSIKVQPEPTPVPIPPPVPEPVPVPPNPTPEPTPPPPPSEETKAWLRQFIDWLKRIFGL